jgi:siderophore synthetase component
VTGDPEGYLARRVLDALLREDYGGLRRHASRPAAAATTLQLPGGRSVRLCHDGFLADHRVAADEDLRLAEVITALRHLADPGDDVAAFIRECHETLATLRLHAAHGDEVIRRLKRSPIYYDVLGAHLDHPVYPTARCRLGLSERQLRAYAPEFAPTFRLRWAAVERDRVTAAGSRPDWWPAPADVGLPAAALSGRDLFPVHPITATALAQPAADAVPGDAVPADAAPGRAPDVELAPEPYLEVRPTLSMRTVAVAADVTTHLKVPLPTSTLGRRNRRTIAPGTLHDGALVQRLLAEISARAPGGTPVILADEQTYGHAADPLLGYLVRRLPAATATAAVPVAALLAPGPGRRYVIEELTSDIVGFFDAYLRALFGWHVALFGYGIALEAHQQNVSVVPSGSDGALRLLIKDGDGALLDPDALAPAGLGPVDVHDERMLTTDREALARVFVTITLHLCAGAIAFGLAERGLLPLPTGLGLIRDRLAEAIDEHDQPFLRARTLDADRLPTKAMVTAGTLVDKARTGAQDINKHYGPPGPNYLREDQCS